MTDISLTPQQEIETYRLIKLYRREASRCHEGKAYLAGCIMLGSALEATLLVFLHAYTDQATIFVKTHRNQLADKPLIRWSLAEMLDVAKNLGWLPSGLSLEEKWLKKYAQIGDYAEVVREIRNLVHPACYSKTFHRKRATKRYFDWVSDILAAAIDYLASFNNECLRRHMEMADEML